MLGPSDTLVVASTCLPGSNHTAALSRLGSQSSSKIEGSSPEKNSIGGAFPCLRRPSGGSGGGVAGMDSDGGWEGS